LKVRFTPAARSDLESIFREIAQHNPIAAQQVEDRLRWTAEGLGRFPGIGAPTDTQNVRRLPVVRYPYTIFYRVNASGDVVEVLRIIHAARVVDRGRLPKDPLG
jgi:plasmid stabilization system protein ParE